ncbi:hypothetical protein [Clostridium sp. HV4-5-A1G]|uniref:hypothetical protein n=1 Tax=Clostridium sp. HV4-5-A1G TaxID=2004595 RepID=UPI0012398992|nr:hypothetical protein [Clostridium sp. HV4-5-A1G]KAA8679333.1 hypothetical protein F3O63_00970 [Clostridium sp. HV4-5-A1G]
MLEINWMEIFLRLIPETFLVIWGIHIIAGRPLDIKKYIFLSFIVSMITFFVRDLPIYFGVHTIIIIILIIVLMVIIGIPLITSIYGTLFMFLMLSLSEFLNMLILKLFGINTNINSMEPIKKSLMGIPSLAILFLAVVIIRYLLIKRRIKNVPD